MVNLIHLDGIEVKIPDNLPVVPVRDLVVFPNHILPLLVARSISIKAVEHALKTDKLVFLVTQRRVDIENPTPEDLYYVGSAGIVLRMLRVGEKYNKMKVLIQGLCKARIVSFIQNEPFYVANVEMKAPGKSKICVRKTRQIIVDIKEKLDQLIFNYGKVFPVEVLSVIENLNDPEKLGHLIAANLGLETFKAQEILEIEDSTQKLISVNSVLDEHIRILKELKQNKTQ